MGKPLPPKISHERIWEMMQAAQRFGFEAFWSAEREWQALMIGQMILESFETALKTFDANPANYK